MKNENDNDEEEKLDAQTPSVFNDQQNMNRQGFVNLVFKKKISFNVKDELFHSNSSGHKDNCSPTLRKREQKSTSGIGSKYKKNSQRKVA